MEVNTMQTVNDVYILASSVSAIPFSHLPSPGSYATILCRPWLMHVDRVCVGVRERVSKYFNIFTFLKLLF